MGNVKTNHHKITIPSEKEMAVFAKRIAARLKGGEVLLLQGELGAGKTTFTRALAQALGVRGRIKSPTFMLMQVHRSGVRGQVLGVRYLVHCDAYRVDAGALKDIGLMDYVGRPDTVVVVEWGEKIKPLLKGWRYTTIKFQHGKKENERVVQIIPPRKKPLQPL